MSGIPPREVIDADVRKTIALARELAALKASGLAAHTGSDPADVLGAYASAFGEAKVLLRALADIADRLLTDEQAKRRRQFRQSLRSPEASDG